MTFKEKFSTLYSFRSRCGASYITNAISDLIEGAIELLTSVIDILMAILNLVLSLIFVPVAFIIRPFSILATVIFNRLGSNEYEYLKSYMETWHCCARRAKEKDIDKKLLTFI